MTLYKRIWPSTILSTLFDPILYLLAVGFALGQYVTGVGDGSCAQFIAPGMAAVMHGAAYEAAWHFLPRRAQLRHDCDTVATQFALIGILPGAGV